MRHFTFLCVLASVSTASLLGSSRVQDDLAAILAQERAEADGLRRRGRLSAARRLLEDILADDENDAGALRILALCRLDAGHYSRALAHSHAALAAALAAEDRVPGQLARCAVTQARILRELGRNREALEVLLDPSGGKSDLDLPVVSPAHSAEQGLALGEALLATGDREAAHRVFEESLHVRRDAHWTEHLAAGRSAHRLGRLTLASKSLVLAERVAESGTGPEADVLSALADVYYESEREVEAQGKRSAADLYRMALEVHPNHPGALLGLFELHRYNRRRVSRSPEDILAQLLGAIPDSLPGRVAKISADLTDGRLKAARSDLEWLKGQAPNRRDGRILRAALAWIEHDRDRCASLLRALQEEDPEDSAPERQIGFYLVALYRFSEALPFLQSAVGRDSGDWEALRLLGQALANTGREDEAAEALEKAEQAAGGRQDALRKNLRMVLGRMKREQVIEVHGPLEFAWRPDAADVLRTYLVPFYLAAREDLSSRYGHTAGTTRIEVFRAHKDFSVRSVGFEGFPALGVCFGPVVTALSPLSEMRGRFSWARTGFHEFSHVVHLGLSHNRCPRWITEGLATWEEVRLNPAWTRNMRRELLDSRANGRLIPVRELNRAFRGPRILFGYYQGGLLCEMLIDAHGFNPMIRLLAQFDSGADLDQAFERVFELTPEQVDRDFEDFVDAKLAGLILEPRWQPEWVVRKRLQLGRKVPEQGVELWREGWIDVAFGSWQRQKRTDALEALRLAGLAGPEGHRALALRGEMALESRDVQGAQSFLEQSIEAGGRDYRALMGLATLLASSGKPSQAERYWLMAEQSFPGYDAANLSAERDLAKYYGSTDQPALAAQALERWLAWNADAYPERLEVAHYYCEVLQHGRAAKLYEQANEVDPFRRDLHLAWGSSLAELERWEEALREYSVAILVPADLDLDHQRYIGPPAGLPHGADAERLHPQLARGLPPEHLEGIPLTPDEIADIRLQQARCARALGREEQAVQWETEGLRLRGEDS